MREGGKEGRKEGGWDRREECAKKKEPSEQQRELEKRKGGHTNISLVFPFRPALGFE